jgi:hypothetical protein
MLHPHPPLLSSILQHDNSIYFSSRRIKNRCKSCSCNRKNPILLIFLVSELISTHAIVRRMNHHLTTPTLLTHVSRFNSLCKLDECNSLFLTPTFIYLYLSYQSQHCKQLQLLYFQALLSRIHNKLIIHAFIYSFHSNKYHSNITIIASRGGW